ncbi:MAG TPA: hypothetical protein VH012_09175 [Acidimicrobiales bacterium]|nr:hypothetical protein [Acidimicrobiales bacterium]
MRGRPNWWVILAVSLGLMALLVATAGGPATGPHRGNGPSEAAARLSPRGDTHHAGGGDATTTTTTAAAAPTTAPSSPAPGASTNVASSVHTTGTSGTAGAPAATSAPAAPSVTTTTLAPVTTTTLAGGSLPADRTQTQGYLNPPLQTSNQFAFTGTGAMEVSVVWSGNTYLTMQVSCPSGSQNVGGTSVMAASLPDASGSCVATVSEPASETTSLTYTITIGPAGG